ncbi:MAG: dihydroxy-acid dehydratase, partial [Elusimicrobia bacterium]|nr:dihydroxy-acid dehydratase [Elusimicrobiota bacterium]
SVGMPVLTQLGRALAEKGFQDSVVVLTDGRVRLEGTTPAIVQVAPEAAVGGTLAILEDGDVISWDFSQGAVTLRLTESEIRVRLSRWKEQTSNLKSGFLSRYLKYASSTALGATLS